MVVACNLVWDAIRYRVTMKLICLVTDVCRFPTHQFDRRYSYNYRVSVGCVNAGLFWVRCCDAPQPKAVYRRVKNCNKNSLNINELAELCEH